MSFEIKAPYPAQQTFSLLPNPQFGDLEALTDRVTVKRATNGTVRSYVRTTDDRRRLKWTFRLTRNKALELFEFIRSYYAQQVWVTDHNRRNWIGKLTNSPFESESLRRGLVGTQGLPGETYQVTLEFQVQFTWAVSEVFRWYQHCRLA